MRVSNSLSNILWASGEKYLKSHNRLFYGRSGSHNKGKWSGARGNSLWYSSKPEVIKITKGKGVPYKDGRADFSEWKFAEFKVPSLKGVNDNSKILNKIKIDTIAESPFL